MTAADRETLRIFAGSGGKQLAESMAQHLNLRVSAGSAERFPDGEVIVRVQEDVRGRDCFVVQSTCEPVNDRLVELLVWIDCLRRASARRITAVIPYFGYARQDRRTSARTPISAKLVANLMAQAGINRVLTLDLHAGQIQGFFDIPVDNLYASPVFAMDIQHNFEDLSKVTIISPDVGGVARAREIAKRLNLALAIVDKRRSRPGEVDEMTIIGEVEGRTCIIVDDICDTAGTLCKAAQLLKDNGAEAVHAYISHGVLSGPAVERVKSSVMESLVITDSIPLSDEAKAAKNIRTVSVAPMLAQAILNVANDTSVSSLFSEDTLRPIYEAFYRFD